EEITGYFSCPTAPQPRGEAVVNPAAKTRGGALLIPLLRPASPGHSSRSTGRPSEGVPGLPRHGPGGGKPWPKTVSFRERQSRDRRERALRGACPPYPSRPCDKGSHPGRRRDPRCPAAGPTASRRVARAEPDRLRRPERVCK